MTLTAPLKWHGGKSYLAPWILSHFPPHVHYVEPYAGGLAVLLAKPPELVLDHSEVINDINNELTTFWAVLRAPEWFEKFKRTVEATPFSQGVFDVAVDPHPALTKTADEWAVSMAFRLFVKVRMSRQGLMKDFATLSKNRTRRRMNEQVSAWLTSIEGLAEVHDRLKRVLILNNKAVNVIRSEDSKNTLFYLDPTYLHETRTATDAYQYEMSVPDHIELLEALCDIEGKFILSGYPSDLYDEFATARGWRTDEKEIDNKAGGGSMKRTMVEKLWMNF
jgi:DNA adenine methylase